MGKQINNMTHCSDNDELARHFGNGIRQLMEQRSYESLSAFALALDMSQSTLSQFINGKRKEISLVQLCKFISIFDPEQTALCNDSQQLARDFGQRINRLNPFDSSSELAAAIGIADSDLSKMINGTRKRVKFYDLCRMSAVLGVGIYELFTDYDPETPEGIAAVTMINSLMLVDAVSAEQLSIDSASSDAKTATSEHQSIENFRAFTNRQNADAKAQTQAQKENMQNRQVLLANVWRIWIMDVFEYIMHDNPVMDIQIKLIPDVIPDPWDSVKPRKSDAKVVRPDIPIIDIFDGALGQLLILGSPGSGKTVALLNLARTLLNRAQLDDAEPIPLVLVLSSWKEDISFEDWILEELRLKYYVPSKIGQQLIQEQAFTLLLDGLDELESQYQEDRIHKINDYLAEQLRTKIAVCARTDAYMSLKTTLRLREAIELQPLDERQIVQYLNHVGDDGAKIQRLIDADKPLRELAHSPLMLRIMVQAFANVPAQDVPDFGNIDTQRNHLLGAYVNQTLAHVSNDAPYSKQELLGYLHEIAQKMLEHQTGVFYIEAISPNWLTRIDYRHYVRQLRILVTFLSVSIMYLLPQLITSVLSGSPRDPSSGLLAFAIVTGLFATSRLLKYHSILTHVVIGFVVATLNMIERNLLFNPSVMTNLFLLIVDTTYTGMFSYGIWQTFHVLGGSMNHVTILERLQFERSEVKWTFFLVGFAPGGLFPQLFANVEATLLMRGLAFLLGAVTLGLLALFMSGHVSKSVENRITPNQGIKDTHKSALQMSLLFSLGMFLWIFMSVILIASWQTALINSLNMLLRVFFPVWLVFGGYSLLQHLIIRNTLSRRGTIVWELPKFLDFAASLILLRKVGGGYIFMHRYLLEYFASLDSSKEPDSPKA